MIGLQNVCKDYHTRQGRRRVLHDINLRVAPGEKIGILGRNGAGKSTMIRMISGGRITDLRKNRSRDECFLAACFWGGISR